MIYSNSSSIYQILLILLQCVRNYFSLIFHACMYFKTYMIFSLILESSALNGLDQSNTDPTESRRRLMNDDYGITFSRPMTEKLDKLSEREKVCAKLHECDCDFCFFFIHLLDTFFFVLSDNWL